MKKALAIFLSVLLVPACLAQEEAEHGPYLVASVRVLANGNAYLNIGAEYPNQTMTIFIPAASASNFAPTTFRLKQIMVRGKIVTYKDKPEIVVNRPAQIRVLE